MANFTEKAIKHAFIELLEEHPLTEITVKSIVEKCEINRNTFYYHFDGLPELIEDIVHDEAENIIGKYSNINTISECFDAIVDFASHEKRAIMHIFKSVNRDVFEFHLMRVSEYFVRLYINSVIGESVIPEENREDLVGYYRCVCFGLIICWLSEGMKNDQVETFRRLLTMQIDNNKEIIKLIGSSEK